MVRGGISLNQGLAGLVPNYMEKLRWIVTLLSLCNQCILSFVVFHSELYSKLRSIFFDEKQNYFRFLLNNQFRNETMY